MTELEKIARFIAHYRTRIAKSSVQKIDEFINWYEDSAQGVFQWENEIKLLQTARSKIEKAANNEDVRYAELVEQDILARLQAIQGVESVGIYTDDEGWQYLEVNIQAYCLFNGRVYDAGYWEWEVPMVDASDNIIPVLADEDEYMLDDGTFFVNGMDLLRGTFIDPEAIDGEHPLYHDYAGFCFGKLAREIDDYLRVGDFVSVFQLVSLCLNHVNDDDTNKIPHCFVVAKDVDIRDLADYFGLSDEDVKQMERERDDLDKLLTEY